MFETPPAPIPNNNLFAGDGLGNGSPAWQGGSSYGRSSPAQWHQQPQWPTQWENTPASSTTTGGGGGWPVEGGAAVAGWRGGVHPTNPFGTSPSGAGTTPMKFPGRTTVGQAYLHMDHVFQLSLYYRLINPCPDTASCSSVRPNVLSFRGFATNPIFTFC